ncbi:MAG: thioesterase domain-containing protein, partial [Chloroflexota bacterium]
EYTGLRVSYACSEIGTITHQSYEVGAKLPDGPVPLGYPSANRTIEIWDENDQEVELGQPGEIIVGGSDVYPSYLGDINATQTAFIPNPKPPGGYLYRTGDLGKILPDGQLTHLGRKDNMIKIRGYRVETSRIESELLKQDYIENAVVVGRPDASGQIRLVAYVVLSGTSKLDVSKLRKAIASKLADYMMPAYFVVLDSIPLTVSNKVDRMALPNPKYGRPDLGNTYIPANNQTETKLCAIWGKVLGIDNVGAGDNFFDLGGDSLLAAQLFVEIEKGFGRKLPISILYKASNVRQQADILLEAADDAWSPLVSINIDGSKPPLFCFPGKGGNPTRFRHLSERLGNDQPIQMLQSRGISGKLSPFDGIEQIAQEFMEAIREVQPEGPYYLIGSSFGGKVAYEVAQQIIKSGQEVALLAFVDTYGPGYPQKLANTSRAKERFIKVYQYINKHIANLRVASWHDKAQYLRHNSEIGLRRIKDWPLKLKDQFRARRLPAELKAVEAANIRASRAYVPQPYPGSVIIFRAEQQPWGIVEDPKLGWGAVGIADLEIVDIPGHH